MKRTKMKVKPYHKVGTRKNKRDRLDAVVRKYVALTYSCCVTCGSTNDLECSHLFSRVRWTTRWLERNLCCQCKVCNQRHEHNQVPLITWAHGKYGYQGVEEIFEAWNAQQLVHDAELDALLEYWTDKVSELEAQQSDEFVESAF